MPERGASPETIRDYVDWCLGELSLEEKVWKRDFEVSAGSPIEITCFKSFQQCQVAGQ